MSGIDDFNLHFPGESDIFEEKKPVKSAKVVSTKTIWDFLFPAGLKTPGKFEDVSSQTTAVFRTEMEIFDGMKVEYTRTASQYLQIQHALSMGSSMEPASYSFNSAFAKEKTLLHARWGDNGILFARFRHQFDKLILNAQAQAGSPNPKVPTLLVVEGEYRGSDSNVSVSFNRQNQMVTLSYLQSITPKLSLGSELTKHSQGTALAFGGVWNTPKWAFSAQVVPASLYLQVAYLRKAMQTKTCMVNLSTQFVLQPGEQGLDTVAQIGAEMRNLKGSVRTVIDSSARIYSVFEEKLDPNLSLLLSTFIDYPTSTYKIGLGLNFQS